MALPVGSWTTQMVTKCHYNCEKCGEETNIFLWQKIMGSSEGLLAEMQGGRNLGKAKDEKDGAFPKLKEPAGLSMVPEGRNVKRWNWRNKWD